jgi:hypothetical protein
MRVWPEIERTSREYAPETVGLSPVSINFLASIRAGCEAAIEAADE